MMILVIVVTVNNSIVTSQHTSVQNNQVFDILTVKVTVSHMECRKVQPRIHMVQHGPLNMALAGATLVRRAWLGGDWPVWHHCGSRGMAVLEAWGMAVQEAWGMAWRIVWQPAWCWWWGVCQCMASPCCMAWWYVCLQKHLPMSSTSLPQTFAHVQHQSAQTFAHVQHHSAQTAALGFAQGRTWTRLAIQHFHWQTWAQVFKSGPSLLGFSMNEQSSQNDLGIEIGNKSF